MFIAYTEKRPAVKSANMPRQFITILLALLLADTVYAKVETSSAPEVKLEAGAPESNPPVSREPLLPRGEMLYTNHCLDCHESLVHIREKRQVKNLDALRATVIRWSQELELKWSSHEIADVVLYLNMRYYHYTE